MIRVLLFEDNADLGESLGELMKDTDDIRLIAHYTNAQKAEKHVGFHHPDVVLMDINLPGITGIACIAECKPKREQVQYLVSTVFEDNENIFNALSAGATGYLLKSAPPEQVVRAIHDIHAGGSPMSLHIARKLVESVPRKKSNSALLESLTKREREVLDQLAGGYRYKEIADRMELKIDTVRSYIRDIYTKLHVQSRTDALNKVFER